MNFFLRQSITGLLRHAADTIPETSMTANEIATHLDRMMSVKWLDRAFGLFQQATFLSGDPVFVTAAVWTVQAMNEVSRYQRRAGILADDETLSLNSVEPPAEDPDDDDLQDLVAREAERGVAELFERIRLGASLEQALALFPLLGDENEA